MHADEGHYYAHVVYMYILYIYVHVYLDWRISALYIKTKPWRRAVEIVQNPSENFDCTPQTFASSPHHFQSLVIESVIFVVIVNSGKEEAIHPQLCV